MTIIASPLATNQNAIPIVASSQIGKFPGLHMHFPSLAAFQAAVAVEQGNVAAGNALWTDLQPMSVSGEPVGMHRVWSVASSHARTVVFRAGLTTSLPSDSNVVLAAVGAPSSGTGNNGDISVDFAGNAVYTKTSGNWIVLVGSIFPAPTAGALPTLPSYSSGDVIPVTVGGISYGGTIGGLGNWLITTLGINRPPIAVAQASSTVDTNPQISGNLLSGTSDPDGDAYSLTALSYNGTSENINASSITTALGLFYLAPSTGAWTFNLGAGARALNLGEVGHEVFTYTISDGKGGVATSTFTISITGTNSVPVVNYVNNSTPINTTVTGSLIAHYAFDYEGSLSIAHFKIEGDLTTYAAGTNHTITSVGSITINPDGTYTFVPVTDWYGPVPRIKYTISDIGSPANLVDAFLTLAVTPLAPGATPIILWTNNPSGPVAGGENGHGCFLEICGLRFGTTAGLGTTTKVYVGGVEVARYFPIQDAAVAPRLIGAQALTVQLANMDSSLLGIPLPVTVVVSGNVSNANWTFTPNPANIYYVSLSGSDTTGTANDITKPFRTLQHATRTDPAVWPNLQAGDHVVIHGGAWGDIGFDGSWCRFRDTQQMGSNPTGVAGTGWICFMPYPGETVHYSTPSGGNKGGFQGPASAYAGETGEWIAVSGLTMDVSGGSSRDAASVNMQYSTGHWRVTNMKIGPWIAGNSAVLNAAAITGAGNFVDILGNWCHDIEGTSALQNHGLYAGTLSYGWNVGFNWFQNCIGGSHIQFNDSDGGTGTFETPFGIWQGFTNIKIHHNFFEVSAKYAVNFADVGANLGDLSFQMWNNIIVGTALPPLRLNTTTVTSDCVYAFNTVYDCCRVFSGTGNGYLRNEGTQNSPDHSIKSYNNIFAFGPNTVAGASWFSDYSGSSSGYTWSRNLYFAHGQAPSNVADTLGIYADPLFTAPLSLDFSLQTTSPAINAGTQSLPAGMSVDDDFTAQASRLFGGAPEIGAMEYGQTTPYPVSVPTSTGGAQVGVANNCSVGTWGNSPTTYTRQAYVDGVAKGSLFTGTGGASYTPIGTDTGGAGVLSWQISATNVPGTSVYNLTVGTIAPGVGHPVNSVAPVVTGSSQAGVQLSTDNGTWTGGTIDSFSYAWQRDGVTLSGATSSVYTQSGGDVGHKINSVVRAISASKGDVSASSAQGATVIAAAANPTYVQEVTATTPASTNATFTLPSNVATGNLIIGWFISWDQAPDNYTRTDNQGHTSGVVLAGARVSFGGSNPHGQFLYVPSSANGSYTMTVNQNGGLMGSGIVTEVAGIDASSTFDIPQDSNTGTGTAITLTAATATTKPNDLIYVGIGVGGTGHVVTLPDSNWVLVGTLDGQYNSMYLYRRKTSSVETFSFAATIDSSTYWIAQSMVIKGS